MQTSLLYIAKNARNFYAFYIKIFAKILEVGLVYKKNINSMYILHKNQTENRS